MAESLEFDPNVIIPQLRGIQKGQCVVYYRGDLANTARIVKETPCNEVGQIALTALNLAKAGKLHLVQRRLGLPMKAVWDGMRHQFIKDYHDGVGPGFEYIAIGA